MNGVIKANKGHIIVARVVSKGEHRTGAAACRTAIQERTVGDGSLYWHNRSLTEAFWTEISDFHLAWIARVASELQLDLLREEVIWYQGRPSVTIPQNSLS